MPAPAGTRSAARDVGQQPSHVPEHESPGLRAHELLGSGPPEARRESPQTPVAHLRCEVRPHDTPSVRLAAERQYGVRAHVDRPVDHPGHVDPQEGPTRVRNGIDRDGERGAGPPVPARGTRPGTARWTPLHAPRWLLARSARRSLWSPAQFTNHRARIRTGPSVSRTTPPLAPALDPIDAHTGAHLAAGGPHVVGQGSGHSGVVGDRCGGDEQTQPSLERAVRARAADAGPSVVPRRR